MRFNTRSRNRLRSFFRGVLEAICMAIVRYWGEIALLFQLILFYLPKLLLHIRRTALLLLHTRLIHNQLVLLLWLPRRRVGFFGDEARQVVRAGVEGG